MTRASVLPVIGGVAWRPFNLSVATSTDEATSVAAVSHPNYPGLAVHRALDHSEFGESAEHFTISHVASGHAVIQGIRRADVKRHLASLLCGLEAAGDWTLSAAAIDADVETRTRMQRAVEACNALVGHTVKIPAGSGVHQSALAVRP